MDCVKCGSDENTKNFYHFDSGESEVLCWDCRYPIIQERMQGGEYGFDDEEDESDDELNGQTGLGDF